MISRQTFVAVLVALTSSFFVVRSAAAQDVPARVDFSHPFVMSAASAPVRAAGPDVAAAVVEKPRTSMLLKSLYATTAIVQGLDAHSTLKAINAGAREGNPLMSPFASHPPAFVALKAGAAAGLIVAGRRLARHNKVQAAVALIAINSAYALVAVHNYRTAARMR